MSGMTIEEHRALHVLLAEGKAGGDLPITHVRGDKLYDLTRTGWSIIRRGVVLFHGFWY